MKVLFVSSGNTEKGLSPIVKSQGDSLEKENVSLEYFLINGRGLSSYVRNIKLLNNYLKTKEFDIIHAHYGLSAIVALLGKGKQKLIVSFMGDDIVGSNDLNGKITIESKFFIVINKFLSKYFFDYSIVKSKEMLIVLDSTKCKVIPNGVDFSRFYEIKRSFARDYLKNKKHVKQILFCSNPKRPEKNFNLAKKAMNYLDDDSIELKYIHNINQENLVYHYNAADCLILTSFHEGSPNVIKEAMACNIQIISTDVGDVREVIGMTKGCFISTYDPKDVGGKIRNALDFNIRTTGREDVRHLESSIVANEIIEVYKKVLKI